MRADRRHVVHLPGPGLVAIRAAGQSAHRADVDALAALLAVQLAALPARPRAVGGDRSAHAAILHSQRPHVHALAADADAAVAEDAARAVVVDGRRPLLLLAVVFGLGVEAFPGAVLEGHVLQFALAAGVADRAVERVVAQQQLDHRLARLRNLGRVGDEDLSLGDRGGAGGLQLGHFFLAHQAHPAGGLQAQPRVIAEGRNLDARPAAGVNQQRPGRSRQLLSIDNEVYVCHSLVSAFSLAINPNKTLSPVILCHPERSAAKSKDLRLLFANSTKKLSVPHPFRVLC